jgi:hypothetical protein
MENQTGSQPIIDSLSVARLHITAMSLHSFTDTELASAAGVDSGITHNFIKKFLSTGSLYVIGHDIDRTVVRLRYASTNGSRERNTPEFQMEISEQTRYSWPYNLHFTVSPHDILEMTVSEGRNVTDDVVRDLPIGPDVKGIETVISLVSDLPGRRPFAIIAQAELARLQIEISELHNQLAEQKNEKRYAQAISDSGSVKIGASFDSVPAGRHRTGTVRRRGHGYPEERRTVCSSVADCEDSQSR